MPEFCPKIAPELNQTKDPAERGFFMPLPPELKELLQKLRCAYPLPNNPWLFPPPEPQPKSTTPRLEILHQLNLEPTDPVKIINLDTGEIIDPDTDPHILVFYLKKPWDKDAYPALPEMLQRIDDSFTGLIAVVETQPIRYLTETDKHHRRNLLNHNPRLHDFRLAATQSGYLWTVCVDPVETEFFGNVVFDHSIPQNLPPQSKKCQPPPTPQPEIDLPKLLNVPENSQIREVCTKNGNTTYLINRFSPSGRLIDYYEVTIPTTKK